MGRHADQERINDMLKADLMMPGNHHQSGFRFPVRFFFLINSFFAFILVYAHKVVLSVTIVKMVVLPALDSDDSSSNDTSITLNNNGTSSGMIIPEGQVSPILVPGHTKSLILGAFFWGYIASQVPAGRLAERFGAKWLLGISMLVCSVISFLIPIATLHEHYWLASQDSCWTRAYAMLYSMFGQAAGLQVLRIIQGFCSGVAHPCMHALITRWTPRTQRSMTTAFIYSGSQIGTLVTMPIAGFLCSTNIFGGWPAIYYFLGISGIIWFASWCILVYDKPDSHPFIHSDDLAKLKLGIGNEVSHNNKKLPWGAVFTSVPVYALTIAHFGQNFGFFMLLTYLPTYLDTALHIDIKNNGVISSIPYLAQAVSSWAASYVSDRIVRSEKYSLSFVRKSFNSIGFFGPALCFMVMSMAPGSYSVVITSLIFALGLNGCAMSGFHVTHVDMAPDFAGTLMGITNGISNFNGVLIGPIINLITKPNGERWWIIFLIAAGVYIVTNSIYCIFGTSETQPWALKKKTPCESVVHCAQQQVAGDSGKPDATSGKDGYCTNAQCNKPNAVLNGVNHFCDQITQNYNNLRKSSNNFTVFDRKLGHSDSLVPMCDSVSSSKQQIGADTFCVDFDTSNQHVNTAFNGDLSCTPAEKLDEHSNQKQ